MDFRISKKGKMTFRGFPLIWMLFFWSCFQIWAQNHVAITIDDVPNTSLYQSENYRSGILDKIDSLRIPVAIFINEGLLYKTDSVTKNFELLNRWVKSKNTTIGNHTFSHSRYSEVGYGHFHKDIEKGAYITRELIKKYGKKLTYFRFPYNDLGADSIQHVEIERFLRDMEYKSTPFTIESSDWMFNALYENYLHQKEYKKAEGIGSLYLSKTMEYFQFLDSLAIKKYGRKIPHIYLCHDNRLNTDFLIPLLSRLRQQGYNFIRLDEALKDSVYVQDDTYYKKWGISWLYRWMSSQRERMKWMGMEPDMKEVERRYNNLNKK
ncbi:MAG: polysaccharide deacetylase family protein [Flavobacteriaceae bacterium]